VISIWQSGNLYSVMNGASLLSGAGGDVVVSGPDQQLWWQGSSGRIQLTTDAALYGGGDSDLLIGGNAMIRWSVAGLRLLIGGGGTNTLTQ
jgi:hypothetical protein